MYSKEYKFQVESSKFIWCQEQDINFFIQPRQHFEPFMLYLIVILGCLELLSYKMASSVAIEDKQPELELNELAEHLKISLVNYTLVKQVPVNVTKVL